MKRILLITENLGSGGAERQICGLAVALTNLGYPCRLITYVHNQFYEPYLKENGVDYEFVPDLYPKKTRVIRVARYVRKFRPDVVISYLLSTNLTICLASLFVKSKMVVSERNNNTSITLEDKFKFNLYRLADAVVPNSDSQGNFICSNFSFLKHKVYPIINFVDLERFRPTVRQHKSEILRFVIVARYTYQKNVLRFLEVVRMVKDAGLCVRFDWYGSKEYDPEYFAKIVDVYEKLDITDYITLHSPSHNIDKVYQESDVLCLPSIFEGYPNVIIEAMASELPVICSNRYENPYIVEDGINGFLFNPEIREDIFSAIKRVSELTFEERKEMGKHNRSLCLVRNTMDVFAESYVNLIETL